MRTKSVEWNAVEDCLIRSQIHWGFHLLKWLNGVRLMRSSCVSDQKLWVLIVLWGKQGNRVCEHRQLFEPLDHVWRSRVGLHEVWSRQLQLKVLLLCWTHTSHLGPSTLDLQRHWPFWSSQNGPREPPTSHWQPRQTRRKELEPHCWLMTDSSDASTLTLAAKVVLML